MRYGSWLILGVLVLSCVLPGCSPTVTPVENPTQSTTQHEDPVNGFEDRAELDGWEITSAGVQLVPDGVTQGKSALELTFDPTGEWSAAGMSWKPPRKDWSAFDVLMIDVFNPNDYPVSAAVMIGDEAWDEKPTYWNRHNGGTFLAPGQGTWIIPVRGLFRGESVSRNNDIKSDIDPTRITRVDLSFGRRGNRGRVIVDNIRFVKSDRPENVLAFDFGPVSQAVMPGWTAVTTTSLYDPQTAFGWEKAVDDGLARDTTFGTMLTQDCIEAGGTQFHVNVPAGEYQVFVIFENAGYWGGEQARHAWRNVTVDGKEVWREERPDGVRTALYQFEEVEPVGVDVWDTYMMSHIIEPAKFKVRAGTDGISLKFDTDAPRSCRISALVVYPDGDTPAAKWLDSQVAALAREFRTKAVNLDGPAKTWQPGKQLESLGLVAWTVPLDQSVSPYGTPPEDRDLTNPTLSCVAVRGEYEPVSLVVKPLVDLGRCTLKLDWTDGKSLPVTVGVLRYNTRRGNMNISYNVRPFALRTTDTVDLPAQINRQFVLTFKVPEDAAAGDYTGNVTLTGPDGRALQTAPLKVTVRDVTLSRKTDFLMGFYGLFPIKGLVGEERYWQYLEETLAMLREHGMNFVTQVPTITLTGWKDGQPVIDHGECDRVFALYRKYRLGKTAGNYGPAIQGLHGRYVKGAEGAKVERESGLDYETALMRVWEEIDRHARTNDWPTILYSMCDETRVRKLAEEEMEFMALMAKVTARFPQTVRTVGHYSVDFNTRPTDPDDMLYWHQRFFETLDISCVNLHDASTLLEGRRIGRDVHIYNQGRDRFTFGLYQWSEFTKGVKARWQWHLNILHGYQFFDLDGREPDTSMIVYGRRGIMPTLAFELCREGAEDFYLLQTLSDAIVSNRKSGHKPTETDRADEMLKGLSGRVAAGDRRAPDWHDAETLKLQVIETIESLR